MGKGGGNDRAQQASIQAQRDQTALARQAFNEGSGVRRLLLGQAADFLGSDIGVNDALFSSPQFQASKATIDAQTQRALDNAISNTPEGGGLSSLLTDIDMARVLGEAQGAGAIADANINRAMQISTFGVAPGISGMSAAGATAAQNAAIEAEKNAGKSSGIGSAAAMAAFTIATKNPGAGAAAAGSGGKAASSSLGSMGSLPIPSDRRLKENIVKVGEISGVNIYRWTWNAIAKSMGISQPTIGVMADEVPEFAFEGDDGYLRVCYDDLINSLG